jgi:hypothetical protein
MSMAMIDAVKGTVYWYSNIHRVYLV